jgi:hypothetical protein
MYLEVTGGSSRKTDGMMTFLIYIKMNISMLSESSVTTVWRVVRLRAEETASTYGG